MGFGWGRQGTVPERGKPESGHFLGVRGVLLHHLEPFFQPAEPLFPRLPRGLLGLGLSMLLAVGPSEFRPAGHAKANWEHPFLGTQGGHGGVARYHDGGTTAVRAHPLLS